jgi:hypothetical protein
MIPKDPVILLSFMNMKLRDSYSSLSALFDDLDVPTDEQDEITKKLADIGYTYDSKLNQFV